MSRIEWCCIAVLALIIAAAVVVLVEEWFISRKEILWASREEKKG